MPLTLVTGPTSEPITVAEAKAWARVDIADDDAMIGAMISAARDFAETKTRRSLMPQTWRLTLDGFPGPSLIGIPYSIPYLLPEDAIILERPPVQSIVSIKYLALDGTTKTLTAGTDYIDLTAGGNKQIDNLARITPPFGKIWPVDVMPQIGAIEVVYTTGYANAAAIPPSIMTWMKLRLATLYDNREEVVVGTRIVVNELPYIDSLIDPWVVELF